jgi:UDP-2,3-diacylglucosamine hydrolase
MPATLFISDLHLRQNKPHDIQAFENIGKRLPKTIEAVYILGDFFNAWAGDDDHNAWLHPIKTGLENLTSKVPVYLMAGNRDLLLGKQFCQKNTCHWLDDPTVINLYGKKTLLTHGDLFCSEDIAHQRFRNITAIPWLRNAFLTLPLRLRQSITGQIRQYSQDNPSSPLADINLAFAEAELRKKECSRMLHGHIHFFRHHHFTADLDCIALPMWEDSGAHIIYKDNHQFECIETGF